MKKIKNQKSSPLKFVLGLIHFMVDEGIMGIQIILCFNHNDVKIEKNK